MLKPRIIPCLDVRGGRIVKGVRFQNLRDAGDPATAAAAYEAQGADEIALLDVSATAEARSATLETVRAVRGAIGIPLTVGGGVRTADDALRLLEAGADKVGVNSAAALRPELLDEMAARFGAQCVVCAIDAARGGGGAGDACGGGAKWRVVIRSGQHPLDLDAADWAAEAARRGAGEILLTSWDRDGTRDGYDLELISAVRARMNIPIIASGGAAGPEHLAEALAAGADAALAASIFHDGHWTIGDVKARLAELNLETRR